MLPSRAPEPPLDPDLEHGVLATLARPPRPPADPGLFTSTTLFGEPGIYPDGPPMAPAPGPPLDEHGARAGLASALPSHLGDAEAVSIALDLYDDPGLAERIPEPGPRAAVVLLATTAGEPALAALLGGTSPVARVGLVPMPGSGRIVGPVPDDEDLSHRAVNLRYGAEHPALLAPSLAHDLLWSGPGAPHAEEASLHAVLAATHVQVVARNPWLAHLGTELTRRQNSLAVTLLNSRRPGSATVAVVAPDGPGTIPAGAASMQTPDFWSIPFAPSGDPRTAPTAARRALAGFVAPDAPLPDPLLYDAHLEDLLRDQPGRTWLAPLDQLRAALALGLVDLADVVDATGLGAADAVRALGLAPAVACWDR